MKFFKFIKRPLAALLTLCMLLPSNPSVGVFADTTSTINSENDGFNLSISWGESEFKDGSSFHLVEDSNTSNIITARISYSSAKVMDKDYAPGDLVITVKGIGGVIRNGNIEASVGADKANASSKTRDWSYTWNKNNDTYTFTNNNPITSNSVFSGYFDMVWQVNSRLSKHGYSQDDIRAKLILSDGTTIKSNTLTFSNSTKCDTFNVDISQHSMYSHEGLGIENPEDYVFIRYNLNSSVNTKSRGTNSSIYTFNPDVEGVGSGAIVIASSSVDSISIGDGTYKVTLPQSTYYNQYYVFVAYPKESYSGITTTASLTLKGTYYEGDDNGVKVLQELATDSIQVPVPLDFSFADMPGGIYDYSKDTYYDKYVSSSAIELRGGDLPGSKMITGTTETYYLEGTFNYSKGDSEYYDLHIVDDYMYILQNGGTYRKLESGEYNFSQITIPGTNSLINSNNLRIASDVYEVEVYAFTDGNPVNMGDENFRVFSGVLKSSSQTVNLGSNVTAIGIVIKGLKENIKSFNIPVKVNYHINKTSDLEDFDAQDNLTSGKVVNTAFIKIFDAEGNWANEYTSEDTYIDNTDLQLAENDIREYGGYVDREEDYITFYPSDKSDYRAISSISDISYDGKKFTSQICMGANFSFKESDVPNKFSLYSILPKGISLDGYKVEEDLYNIMTLSGMGLNSEELATHCTPEIINNYKDSGRVYVGLHFDFTGLNIPQNSSIYAYINVRIINSMFKNSGVTIPFRSSVIIDSPITENELNKIKDIGSWDSDSTLANDVDNDGITDENLSYDSDYSSYVYVESSEFRMEKSVKTSASDTYTQLPEIPLAEQGTEYSYMLSLKSGESITTNIVVKDILESGENAEWQGTFNGIDMSSADELGLSYTIYYANTKSPEESDWVNSENWSEELDSVKAFYIDFGSSELKPTEELDIIVNMIAPTDDSLKGKKTENSYSSSFTMVSTSTGNEVKQDELNSNFVQVELVAKLKTIILTKIDAISGDKLSGARYNLLNENGEFVEQGTTNPKGQIIFKNIPSDVSYILSESIAPNGYELNGKRAIAFDEDSDILRVVEEDSRKLASVDIYKSNEGDKNVKVEDAEFTLFTSDGVEVQKKVTDINGKLTFTDIDWGEYYIQETSAPKGYLLDDTIYNVSVTRETVEESRVFNITNAQDGYTEVKLNKYALTTSGIQTDIPVAGAVFKLVRTTAGQNRNLGSYVTDENGEIYVSDLPYGDYLFIESSAPSGYFVANNVSFTLSPDHTSENIKVYDQRKSGNATLTKMDNLGNIVSGAVFELYDESKSNVLGTYTTSDTGVIKVSNLDWGTYYFKEKSTLDCYQLNTDWIEFTIDASNLEVLLSCVNETKKGVVVLNKTDELGLHYLEGAEFSLYKEDGTLLYKELTTDSNGQLKVENLEWGKYYFKETKAPAGYGLTDETIRFAVNSLNAGIEQSLYVTNPQSSKTITISKKILASEINFDNGDPTFLFKVEGTDVNGDSHTYYRIMKFSENYVLGNTAEDGYVSQSVTVSGIMEGTYIVSEEESSRYYLSEVTDLSDNATLVSSTASIDLSLSDTGSVTFVNGKYEHGNYSDNQAAANSIKKQAKLTSIHVQWLGNENVEAKSEIDRSLVQVIANYDDGSYKVLSNTDWSFGAEFTGSTFPNLNGSYLIPITYSEGGMTRSGSFEVTIYGMILEVVSLEASLAEGYDSLEAGSSITPDMLEVYAVYNDGSKQLLNSESFLCRSVVQSPDYPESTTPTEDFVVERRVSGASSFKVSFSTNSVLNCPPTSVDGGGLILIYGDNETLVENLPHMGEWINMGDYWMQQVAPIRGTEYTIPGEYVKIVMTSDATGLFSATIIPLDSDGNELVNEEIGNSEYIVDSNAVPKSGSSMDLKISLSDLSVSTTLNIPIKYPDPILVDGWTFNSSIPSAATEVVFTDSEATTTSTVDLSKESNGSVVGWLEDKTWYVSSQRDGVKAIANEDCYKMFSYKKSIINIDFTYLDTSNVTNMSYMFDNCYSLTSLDVSSFDTSKVTTMKSMFRNYDGLTSLDLSSFDTSNVTDMSYMFDNCNGLTSLDLSSFDTSKVTTMHQMFYYCYSLTSLDLSSFDTSNVTTMSYMFYYCYNLTSLDLSSFDTSKVTNMSYMFNNCKGLTSLDLSSFDTSKVKNMSSMFYECSGLTSLDVSSFDTSNVTDMGFMFYKCSTLTELDLSNFNTSNVTNMYNMFNSCYALESINLSSFNTGKVTDMSFMFCLCKNLLKVDVSNFDTSNVTNMSNMFNSCYVISELDLSSFDTSKVINVKRMFKECSLVINAYARTQKDADMFNNSSEKPTSWMFNSVATPVSYTYSVDSAYEDLVTLELPSTLEEGAVITITPVDDTKVVTSFSVYNVGKTFEVNGTWYTSGHLYNKSFTGNTYTIVLSPFIRDSTDTICITDIVLKDK